MIHENGLEAVCRRHAKHYFWAGVAGGFVVAVALCTPIMVWRLEWCARSLSAERAK